MKPLVDYIHSQGLKFGIYTARGSTTCLGKPGSDGHEFQDALSYASWGVDFLIEDSCGGHTNGTVYEQYARMRDALNATGRPIFFSITEALSFSDHYEKMHCYGDNVFTTIPWFQSGLDIPSLANSALVEYCNNEDFFGSTAGVNGPGGFLSNLDSQQLLTFDNLTQPGFTNDNDMLEVCNGGQSAAEYRSQFSTWAILASNLILGHDPRSQSQDCLNIITNTDVIKINQDPLVIRGKLVLQWPSAVYPTTNNATNKPSSSSSPPHHHRRRRLAGEPDVLPAQPLPTANLAMVPCDSTDPAQIFSYSSTDKMIRNLQFGDCFTYLGYYEANVHMTPCVGYVDPVVGGQLWEPTGPKTLLTLNVSQNVEKVADVIDCDFTNSQSVQVCTFGASDCYSHGGSGPPNCGLTGQKWAFDASASSSIIASAVDNFSHCIARVPLPPPPIILQVWTKPLSNGDVALLAFNRDTFPVIANLSLAMMGWDTSASASLYDVWAHKSIGTVNGEWSTVVPPHDVYMVRATKV